MRGHSMSTRLTCRALPSHASDASVSAPPEGRRLFGKETRSGPVSCGVGEERPASPYFVPEGTSVFPGTLTSARSPYSECPWPT